jgi:hypothetical protein
VPPPSVVYVSDPPTPPPEEPPAPWRFGQPPGWVVSLEAAATRPAVRYGDYFSRGDVVNHDCTAAPRATVGYTFDNGGSVLFSYRNVTSDGDYDLPGFQYAERDRLNANWIDLTYLSRPLGPWRHLRWQWEAGVRGADLFADQRGVWPDASYHARQTFWGAGPHVGLRLTWAFGDSGLALFARGDVGVLVGQTHSHESDFLANGDGTTSSWEEGWHRTRGVVDSRFELGLGWVPSSCPHLRFDAGVQSEVFSWQGLTFSDVGPFLRCTIGF